MTETEGRRLKHVRDSWMDVWLVPAIGLNVCSPQKRRQVLVYEDVLQCRDDYSPRSLENVLVAPRRVHLLDAVGQLVVPAKKENREREQRGVLICARIAENWKR